MHISELVFKRKPIFYFLLFALLLGGVFSFMKISKLEDPEITVMQAQVVCIYPGASAHEVEMELTKVLEEELSDLPGVKDLETVSAPNVSTVKIMLGIDVPQDEINEVWTLLRRKIENVKPKLPEGAQDPIVLDDFGDVYGMFYGMTADGYAYEEMQKYAEFVERELRHVEGVNKVQLYGIQTPSVDIVLSQDKMSELGVYPVQIFTAIQDYNTHVYPGALHSGDYLLRMHVDSEFEDIQDVENLIIKSIDGKNFRLGDVAHISKGYKEPMRNTFNINNQKAIGISLSMASGENIIEVGERVEERLEEIKPQIPLGFEFQKVFFQPDKVEDSINGFMWNLIASVLIVVVVLMFTMGLRSGLIIGSGLVLTILATFPVLMMVGGTLHRISLGAFIVAMGMLVDNAIVVIDGILVDLQKHGRIKRSFVNTAKRTAMPLFGATLIAIIAFLPAYLSPDTAGTYIRDLFMVLCISLMVSWVLALTQVPLHASSFLRVNKKKKGKELYQGGMYAFMRKTVNGALKVKIPVLIVSFSALFLAVWGYRYVEDTFFPDFNYNQAYIEYKLPAGTSPDKVNEDLQEITEHFLSYEEVKLVATSQGMTPTRYCLVRAMGDVADYYGELIVNFDDYETMVQMKPKLEAYLNDNYPDAYIRIRKYNLSISSSHNLEVEFQGPDPSVLRGLSRQAQDIMLQSDYINPSTVCDNWNNPQKSMAVHLDQSAASRSGITRQDISNALLAATDGLPIGTLNEGEQEIEISFKTRDNNGERILDLGDVPVWPMIPNVSAIGEDDLMDVYSGASSVEELSKMVITPVPMSSVTYRLNMEPEEGSVIRLNGQRTIQAQCDAVDGISPVDATNDIKKAIEAIEVPQGYSMKWVGEAEMKGDSVSNIFSYLPISSMIIIIILLLLFNDFKKPFIVLLVIPMAAIGIVPGHVFSGIPFSFVSIIGAFGLAGMLIKNAIVLLDEIGKQIKEGEGRHTAIVNSTVSRARPVLMASFTTILGMLPLFVDPMYKSMAVTIISGLLVGTLITLVFIPVLYAVFHGVKTSETEPRFSPIQSSPKTNEK